MNRAFDALTEAIEANNRRRFWRAARVSIFATVCAAYPLCHLILWGFRGFRVVR